MITKLKQKIYSIGIRSEDLDEMVHATMSQEATSANNKGIDAQLTILKNSGHTDEYILTLAREIIDDRKL